MKHGRMVFSAALCRGLIEAAMHGVLVSLGGSCGFPRLYAAASLKHGVGEEYDRGGHRFPRLYAAASLKQSCRRAK